MTGIYGADVSQPISSDQWAMLRRLDTPVQTATARCYQQASGGEIDANCIQTLKNAKAAGIDSLSVYHFPNKKQDPRTQSTVSISNLASSGLALDYYWLDVEPSEKYDDWSSDQAANCRFIAEWYQATVDTLAAHPELDCDQVGFYTRATQWSAITGDCADFGHTPLWFVYMFEKNRDGQRSFERFEQFGGWMEPTQVQWSLDVPFPDVAPPGKRPAYDLNWSPGAVKRHAKVARPRPVTYKVQPGDTFDSLLEKFGVTKEDFAGLNKIINPKDIENQPGRIVEIPAPKSGQVTVKTAKDAAKTVDSKSKPDPLAPNPEPKPGGITVKTAMEIIGHEAIVTEAYRDSTGVWTWSVGLTNSSGHYVYPKYVDSPRSVTRCLEVFEWALRKKYAVVVDEVFTGFTLTEEQYAAALSFQYNTGGLRRALWVKYWKAGNRAAAYEAFTNWATPPQIIGRRIKERELFFNGSWSNDGTTLVYPVRKPSYKPDHAKAQTIDIHDILVDVLARAGD